MMITSNRNAAIPSAIPAISAFDISPRDLLSSLGLGVSVGSHFPSESAN